MELRERPLPPLHLVVRTHPRARLHMVIAYRYCIIIRASAEQELVASVSERSSEQRSHSLRHCFSDACIV